MLEVVFNESIEGSLTVAKNCYFNDTRNNAFRIKKKNKFSIKALTKTEKI